MEIHNQVDLGKLTILQSALASDSMSFRGWRGASQSVTIYGPGALTGSIKVQVSEDDVNWFDKQSAGADIAIPSDGAVKIYAVDFKYLRVLSSAAEAAKREFIVKGEEGT